MKAIVINFIKRPIYSGLNVSQLLAQEVSWCAVGVFYDVCVCCALDVLCSYSTFYVMQTNRLTCVMRHYGELILHLFPNVTSHQRHS